MKKNIIHHNGNNALITQDNQTSCPITQSPDTQSDATNSELKGNHTSSLNTLNSKLTTPSSDIPSDATNSELKGNHTSSLNTLNSKLTTPSSDTQSDATNSELKGNHTSSLNTLNSKLNTHTSKLKIPRWSEEDRPREKLERLGAQALSSAELLAILIGSGSVGESAVELMKRVMADCNNNLNTLGKKTVRELTAYHGMGPAKAITILAACELGKRRQLEKAEEREDLGSATAIYNHLHPLMQDLDVEEAWVLLMNRSFKLIKRLRLSHGGLSETAVDVRLIIKEALLCNATVIALCHNHPSNNARPSTEDDRLTQRLKAACDTMRIYLADHVIITDGRYYSYNEEGRL